MDQSEIDEIKKMVSQKIEKLDNYQFNMIKRRIDDGWKPAAEIKVKWSEHRNDLEERLTEYICSSDINKVLKYLGIEDQFEGMISQHIEKLSNARFEFLWNMCIPWSIEDEIADMEEE